MKLGIKREVEVDAKVIEVCAKPRDAGSYVLRDAAGDVIQRALAEVATLIALTAWRAGSGEGE